MSRVKIDSGVVIALWRGSVVYVQLHERARHKQAPASIDFFVSMEFHRRMGAVAKWFIPRCAASA